MSSWTNRKKIIESLEKKWKQGDMLRSQIDLEYDPFPLVVKLKTPNKAELMNNYYQVKEWINKLRAGQKNENKNGYLLVEREINYRDIGYNIIPSHVEFQTIDDVFQLINYKDEFKLFNLVSAKLIDYDSCLKPWIVKYPHKPIEKINVNVDKYIAIVDWFRHNNPEHLYIRQFDIHGVDTKFIESNKKTISELLDLCLAQNRINCEETNFEKRYNIKFKPQVIRFRILDPAINYLPFTDMIVTQSEFERFKLDVKFIFMVENEINYLSFPAVANSIIIFTRGYHIDNLANANWLKTKKVYYWGDIDTHGFNILSRLRKFIPHACSFLMNEETLLNHLDLTVVEDKPYQSPINLLSPNEEKLVTKIQTNQIKENLRLEQERIEYKYLLKFLDDNCFENLEAGK